MECCTDSSGYIEKKDALFSISAIVPGITKDELEKIKLVSRYIFSSSKGLGNRMSKQLHQS